MDIQRKLVLLSRTAVGNGAFMLKRVGTIFENNPDKLKAITDMMRTKFDYDARVFVQVHGVGWMAEDHVDFARDSLREMSDALDHERKERKAARERPHLMSAANADED
jgi:hypothetical protein